MKRDMTPQKRLATAVRLMVAAYRQGCGDSPAGARERLLEALHETLADPSPPTATVRDTPYGAQETLDVKRTLALVVGYDGIDLTDARVQEKFAADVRRELDRLIPPGPPA